MNRHWISGKTVIKSRTPTLGEDSSDGSPREPLSGRGTTGQSPRHTLSVSPNSQTAAFGPSQTPLSPTSAERERKAMPNVLGGSRSILRETMFVSKDDPDRPVSPKTSPQLKSSPLREQSDVVL